MAQTGFPLSDEGRTLSALNVSGTTAIVAGDLVYVGTVDDALTGTAASARNAYSAGDFKVFAKTSGSSTGYKTVVGVALEDIPADGYGAVAFEGVFISPVAANVEAGDILRATAATVSKLVPAMADQTTTADGTVVNQLKYKIGKALTGGSADGKYILWKLSV